MGPRSAARPGAGLACLGIALLLAGAPRAAAQGIARISVASDGSEANGASHHPAVSADDRFAAYDSTATNLVPGDTNDTTDIFVYDSLTHLTTRESVGPSGQANGPNTNPAISATGRFVAFASSASNLVPGVSGSQIYVRDRQAAVTIVVSVSTGGAPANGVSEAPQISADGRFVSFTSTADNLVPGDANGVADVFTRDLFLGTTTLDSGAVEAIQNGVVRGLLAISGDARYVAFRSNGYLFVHDRLTGGTTPESLDVQANTMGGVAGASLSRDGRVLAFVLSNRGPIYQVYVRDRLAMQSVLVASGFGLIGPPGLSADGRFVAVATTSLISGTNANVYVYDRLTSRTSFVAAMSRSSSLERPAMGTSALAFSSEFPLTPSDTNGTFDIFATRVTEGGGPGTPTGLVAAVTGSTVVLTWNPSTTGGAALGYLIEAGSAPGGANLATFTTGSSATSYTAPGVGAGTYFVRVRAVNAAGPSDVSNEITVVVSPACVPPGAASNLIAVVAGSTVTLTWSSGTNAASYVLEAGSAPGQTDVVAADLGSPATVVTARGVGNGRYFVRVRSKNVCGISPSSNETLADVR